MMSMWEQGKFLEGFELGFAEGFVEGYARGLAKARARLFNAAIDFMRENGVSEEIISAFRDAFPVDAV